MVCGREARATPTPSSEICAPARPVGSTFARGLDPAQLGVACATSPSSAARAAALLPSRALAAARPQWNVLLDATGGPNHLNNTCDAPIVADATFDEVHLHPQFYFLGHFSKFIPRGSKRVRLDRVVAGAAQPPSRPTDAPGGIYNLSGAVAYGDCPAGPPSAVALKRDDGRVVVVVLNCNDSEQLVRIQLAADGGGLQRTIPSHAIHTYILEPR